MKRTLYTIVDDNDGTYPRRDRAVRSDSEFSPVTSKLFGTFTEAKRSLTGLRNIYDGNFRILKVEMEYELKDID